MSPTTETKAVTYKTDTGVDVKLSPGIIKQYLVHGQGRITDQEVMAFLMLCKSQRLNPFLREAYVIKYGDSPATIVTGKDTFTKRAERDPNYRGFRAGIVVKTESGLEEREGALLLKGEELVGGWAEVYKENRQVPYKAVVSYEEYVGRKNNGEVNSQWKSKPATMIRKVALVQALREAFPDSFSGLYDQSEMSQVIGEVELDENPVNAPEKNVTPSAEGAEEATGPTEREELLKRLTNTLSLALDDNLVSDTEYMEFIAQADNYPTSEKLVVWLESVTADMERRRYQNKVASGDQSDGEPDLPDGEEEEPKNELF